LILEAKFFQLISKKTIFEKNLYKMNFTVRLAQKIDMESVLNLITELAVFENEPHAVDITVEDLIRDGFSEPPKFRVYVAEQENTIIGIALFYERFSTWKGRTLHLEDLIVTKSKQKIGAGKALYTAVLKYAYDHHFNRVAWEVIDWNKNAIDFYKSTGATYLNDWSVVQMNKENLEKFIQDN
jgi:GNAT superfamily N-acetyltransferase